MVDFKGNELKVGDRIIFATSKWNDGLSEGIVTDIKRLFGKDRAEINHYISVESMNIYRIPVKD